MGTSNLLLTVHVFNDLAKKSFATSVLRFKKVFKRAGTPKKKIEQIHRNARLTSDRDKKGIETFHESNNQTHFVICM